MGDEETAGDESEEDSDLDMGSVSNSEKEANGCLRARPLSVEKDHSSIVFRTKGQKKTKADSQKLIDEFRDKHTQEMSKGNRRRHYVRALMACQVNEKATVWQNHFTPFLFVCSTMDLSIFDFMSTSTGIPQRLTPVGVLEKNGWNTPRVPFLASHLKSLLDEAHKTMVKDWMEEKNNMEEQNRVDAIEKDIVEPELFGEDHGKDQDDVSNVQGDEGRKVDDPIGCGWNIRLAVLPSPPTQTQLLLIVHFVRRALHVLHYSWPDSERKDV